MNITMTWADGALALALGVLGSLLAAYLYSRAPRFFNAIAARWAERSDAAATKRLIVLRQRLLQVEAFEKSDIKFIGWIGARLGNLIFRSAMTILFFMLTAAANAVADPADSMLGKVVTLLAGGGFVALLLLILYEANTLIDFQDIGLRREQVEEEMSRINLRLSHENRP